MATGQNPPFIQQASYYFATSSGSSGNAVVANGADTAVVTNLSTANLYVSFGTVANTIAVGSGYCVLPNAQRTIALPPKAIWAITILDASTTGHVYIEMGTGSAR